MVLQDIASYPITFVTGFLVTVLVLAFSSCVPASELVIPTGAPYPLKSFGLSFPFPPIKGNKAFNTHMGPKTMGPQRRTVKLFEVKIYLCDPQMTTLLFENLIAFVP